MSRLVSGPIQYRELCSSNPPRLRVSAGYRYSIAALQLLVVRGRDRAPHVLRAAEKPEARRFHPGEKPNRIPIHEGDLLQVDKDAPFSLVLKQRLQLECVGRVHRPADKEHGGVGSHSALDSVYHLRVPTATSDSNSEAARKSLVLHSTQRVVVKLRRVFVEN